MRSTRATTAASALSVLAGPVLRRDASGASSQTPHAAAPSGSASWR
jgi:hypothetical protein